MMTRSGTNQPTAVELEMLGVMWDLGPSPVREIHSELNASKGTNYSTTVKMLSVMMQKGLVKRDEDKRPHIYRAAISRRRAGKSLMKDLVEKVYEGSAMSLVLQALSTSSATPEEIAEARRLLDNLEDRQ